MGITIHYQGTIDDLSQVETMEDRLLDLIFSLGGRATIWRSFAAHDSARVIRGLLVQMAPGQDSFSLLVSPEGHLTPLSQIKEAEEAPFDEPPCCFVKTQFGSLQGHIAIAHLLDALRQRFISNLQVTDEGGYYENRDVQRLSHQMKIVQNAIQSMAEGLRQYGLSSEASEDPGILATRIERIATLVHQSILRDTPRKTDIADGDSMTDDTSDFLNERSLEEEVEAMDQLRRKNDLRSERMNRRITEACAAGMSIEEAFDLAMKEEGLPVPDRDPEESWMESESWQPFDEVDGLPIDSEEHSSRIEHPAVEQVKELLDAILQIDEDESGPSSFISVLMRGGLEMFGGLVQATSGDDDDHLGRALTISQLKRALSGHAYARGALFGLRSEGIISEEQASELFEQLKVILASIHELSAKAWGLES
jgi:hypothetical protein